MGGYDFGKWLPWLRLSQDSGKPNVLGVIRKDLALPWPGGAAPTAKV